ncbi:MAG: hypothetical protein ACKON7_08495 [Planctomycetaceae bacterium]
MAPLGLHPGDCNPLVAQSPHAGGSINVGFMDGSVRAVASAVTPAVWWAAFTPQGGESGSVDEAEAAQAVPHGPAAAEWPRAAGRA